MVETSRMDETEYLDMTFPKTHEDWTESTDISPVVFTGTLKFSCCGKNQEITSTENSFVECSKCHTVYGVTLSVSLQSASKYKFARGMSLGVWEPVEVRAGSTMVKLVPGQVYLATQDTHGVLNIPPGFQPVLVKAPGDLRERTLVALVPDNLLERVENLS
jgi:hypothetical protein